jgi:hypothetical protein
MFEVFTKDTMMMVALIAVIIGCVYLYKELKKTKATLADVQSRPPVVITRPAPRPAPPVVRLAPESADDSEEIKPVRTVADEQ